MSWSIKETALAQGRSIEDVINEMNTDELLVELYCDDTPLRPHLIRAAVIHLLEIHAEQQRAKAADLCLTLQN